MLKTPTKRFELHCMRDARQNELEAKIAFIKVQGQVIARALNAYAFQAQGLYFVSKKFL